MWEPIRGEKIKTINKPQSVVQKRGSKFQSSQPGCLLAKKKSSFCLHGLAVPQTAELLFCCVEDKPSPSIAANTNLNPTPMAQHPPTAKSAASAKKKRKDNKTTNLAN